MREDSIYLLLKDLKNKDNEENTVKYINSLRNFDGSLIST